MDVFIGFIDTCMYLQNMDMNDKRHPDDQIWSQT